MIKNLLLSVFRPYKFSAQFQRFERLPAVLVELAEEFKALQPQVVHIAAKQVEAKVHGMAKQENHQEGNHRKHVNATTPPASIRAMIRE